jgi:hypothetical protein
MEFNVHFECDNAAFDDAPRYEISRILKELAERIEDGGDWTGVIRDVNGNRIGEFELTGEEEGR